MRKTKIRPPFVTLAFPNTPATLILPENRTRIGLIVNNYGTGEVYLFDTQQSVIAGTGFSIFPGFGLALMDQDVCPQSALYAGQVTGSVANLQVMEITQERYEVPGMGSAKP